MDYPLENLGPERFQQLCQALLTQEQPDVQCFPIAQPDGGRDATAHFVTNTSKGFVVFQVKFSRNPHSEIDPHKWLLEIIENEAPKVAHLIPKGASKYYLITNVSGTAHLDSGSIDKMNSLLANNLPIPSFCWWRDDLNRRLDSAWSIKWSYPDIMTGPDLLRALVEVGLTEDKERRSASIRAFLRQQFESDAEVKFKQIELQNNLLDLFIDVPMALRERPPGARRAHRRYYNDQRSPQRFTGDPEQETLESLHDPQWAYYHSRSDPSGAASLLLDPTFQSNFKRLVIEGAPGQGKSTIAQYVCQVYRMKLLQEDSSFAQLPSEHRPDHLRLPIRIDLRDFATWMNRKNPFTAESTEEPPVGWHRSMESFIAALIAAQAGGTSFTVDDLLAVARITSILLVFDGLDEIADISTRREVVEEIVRGIPRLSENSASLYTIVTSRPASFANSPGMPLTKYAYFQLFDLKDTLILQYAERWIRAKRLDSRLSSEFRGILKERLGQPHLRDLARNPMQLAILLGLILTKGASLPDKRTALYDYYIDLFFSRESEKSLIVREHRDLLMDIHGYLAWVIHSEAEKGVASASVPQDRLLQIISEYLRKEGHNPGFAQELFTGIVDRVVALVSRIEGTFEFEVQPMREYFAAKYLFNSAPQSSPGNEKPGARPDRFDAISRNFYWLNVTRFYAGFYSKGELPSLVECLEDLSREVGFKNISYPRLLATTLLADWVFTQNPRSVQRVVEIVLDGIGVRLLATQAALPRRRQSHTGIPSIPAKCGRDEIIARCFDLLRDSKSQDFGEDVLALAVAYAPGGDLVDQWSIRFAALATSDKQRWLYYGLRLGVLSTIPIEKLRNLLPEEANKSFLRLLYQARRLDFVEQSEANFNQILDEILDGGAVIAVQRQVESVLDAVSHSIDPFRYAMSFNERIEAPLMRLIERINRPSKLLTRTLPKETESYAYHISAKRLAEAADREVEKPAAVWATEIEPWETIVEAGRSFFGDRWSFDLLANVSAGIKSPTDKCADTPDLLDKKTSLCRRARHARLRSTSITWWLQQFDAAQSGSEVRFALLVLFTWATPQTVVGMVDCLEAAVGRLSESLWRSLFYGIRRSGGYGRRVRNDWSSGVDKLPESLNLRLACLLVDRAGGPERGELYGKYLAADLVDDPIVLQLVQEEAFDMRHFYKGPWNPDFDTLKRAYEIGQFGLPALAQLSAGSDQRINLDLAREITEHADAYPRSLVHLAEERCRQEVAANVLRVADIAERDGWFAIE